MSRPDAETVAKLKADHGAELHLIDVQGFCIVVKPVTRPQWKRVKDLHNDVRRRATLGEELVDENLVWPSKDEYRKLCDDKSAIADSFAAQMFELAGATEKAVLEKL